MIRYTVLLPNPFWFLLRLQALVFEVCLNQLRGKDCPEGPGTGTIQDGLCGEPSLTHDVINPCFEAKQAPVANL